MPSGRSLRLTGQVCLVTSEDPASGALDTVEVAVQDDGGEAIVALLAYDNLDATAVCNWASFDVSVAQAYTPGPAVLDLHAVSVAGGMTSFYFDTLQLVATADCP